MSNFTKLQAEFSKLRIDLKETTQITDDNILNMIKNGIATVDEYASFFTYFVSEFLTDGKILKINPYELDNLNEWIKIMVIRYFESKGFVYPVNSSETEYGLSWYGQKIVEDGFSKFLNDFVNNENRQGFNMDEFKRSRRESFQLKAAEEAHSFAKQSNNSTWWLSFFTFVLAISTMALAIATFLK